MSGNRYFSAAFCLIGALACQTDERASMASGGAVDVTNGAGTGDTGSASGGVEQPKLDLPAEERSCSKFDFVFVVDNSHSMRNEQENLIASVPGFIAAIRARVESADFHIMVVDTDRSDSDGCYEQSYGMDCDGFCSACPSGCNCECRNAECSPFSGISCDEDLGAGRVTDRIGNDCGFGSLRYLKSDHPDLEGAFACAADAGLEGDDRERPIQALLHGLTKQQEAGACNDGFLRDDALLVVVLITDEEDRYSTGGPEEWRDALVAVKGKEESVVVLALVGDLNQPDAVCLNPISGQQDGAANAEELRTFAESFTYGDWFSICAPSYVEFFDAAVSTVATACSDFIP